MAKTSHQQPKPESSLSPAGAPTVCIVDADPADYQAWTATAPDAEVRLEFLTNASAALRRARLCPVDLWVINTDLPGLSGTELCRMLKAQSSQSVVVLVSDEYESATEQAAWASRASLFECKPLPGTRLEVWLTHWRQKRPHSAASLRRCRLSTARSIGKN